MASMVAFAKAASAAGAFAVVAEEAATMVAVSELAVEGSMAFEVEAIAQSRQVEAQSTVREEARAKDLRQVLRQLGVMTVAAAK